MSLEEQQQTCYQCEWFQDCCWLLHVEDLSDIALRDCMLGQATNDAGILLALRFALEMVPVDYLLCDQETSPQLHSKWQC